MATKYKFGKIEKHQGDNNTPRRMKVAKNGEDCYRWQMTTLSKMLVQQDKTHKRENDKPSMNKNGQERRGLLLIVNDCKTILSIDNA